MCTTQQICSDGESFFLSKKRKEQVITVDVDKLTEKYINDLHKSGKVDKKTQQELFKSLYQPLKEGINEGYGNPTVKFEYGTPNYEMLKQLQINTAVFSIFKSHALVKETAALLKDEAGNQRSKEDFKREALKMDNTYRVDYLDTEYDTAVRTARMASVWTKAQSTKNLYPNLAYLPSKAAHPRQAHEKYYGLVASIDDPIWNSIMPPNGWRCQCGVEPTDREVTDIPSDLPEPEEGFRNNPGKTGQAFDFKESNYIKSVPPSEQPALIRDATKYVNKDLMDEMDYERMYKSNSGGSVEAHPMTHDNSDFNEVLRVARSLANLGDKVKMLPDIQDEQLRKKLSADGAKLNKNPDYLINDQYAADLKIVSTNSISAVKEAISRCHKQCNNIVLKIDDDNAISSQALQRAVKGQLSHAAYDDFENVWIYYHGHWSQLTREEIVKKGEWPL